MKRFFATLAVLGIVLSLSVSGVSATTDNSITVDGDLSDWDSDEIFGSSYIAGTFTDFRVTWDADNLYFGFQGGEATTKRIVAIDTNPGVLNSGYSNSYANVSFPSYGRPEYIVERTQSGTFGYNITPGNIGVHAVNGSIVEIRIPRSELGSLATSSPVGIYMYVTNADGNYTFGFLGTNSFGNDASGSSSTTPATQFYFPTTDNGRAPNAYFRYQSHIFSGKTISPANGAQFNDVILDGGTLTGPSSGTINVARDFHFDATNGGTFTLSGCTVNFNGNGTIKGGHTTGVTFHHVSIASGATLGANSSFLVQGTWTNDGTFAATAGTATFNGSSAQTIGGASTSTFYNLTINNSNGVSLNASQTVGNQLTLTNGRLTLGSYTLTLGSSATIGGSPGASNMVVASGSGFLKKTSGGTLSSFIFPVGDAGGTGNYTPVTLDCGSTIDNGKYAQVRLVASKHGSMGSTDHIKRYWIMESDDTAVSCTGTFQYVDGDVAGATESNITPVKYSSSVWTQLTSPTTDTANNKLTGSFTSFSDFSGGNWGVLAVDLATFTADATPSGVTLAWETVSETDNAGFNLYRAAGGSVGDRPQQGPWVKLNAALIPAAAPGSSEGHAYTWADATAAPGMAYAYLLEDVAFDGTATRHAPITVAAAGAPNAVGLAGPLVVTSAAVEPSLAGLAALALLALAGAGARRRL